MPRRRALLAVLPAALALAPSTLAPAAAVRNPFDRRECVAWAYRMRPDVYRAVQARRWHANWDAWRWAGYARQAGLPTGTRPAAGALAVWPRGVAGADEHGHVAFVERVGADGTFLVSEANWDGPGAVDVRRVEPAHGLRFIYRRGAVG